MNFKKILFKTLKIMGITIGSILLLMFLLPILFPKTITKKIKQLANNSINGQLNFSGTSLSFFKRFPELTLTLEDFTLKGSEPFQQDTLIAAKDISFAVDLTSLLQSKIKISKVYLSKAFINIEVDSAGHGNYSVYKSQPPAQQAKADTGAASLGIEEIVIEKSHLVYDDASIPTQIDARNFNYRGSGDFTKNIFDLKSHVEIAEADFTYDNQQYVVNRTVNADLVTSINTKSLAFAFQKNDLMINKLPVKFVGRFGFIKDGYDMDFKFTSHQTNLGDIFTALPPSYAKWVTGTEVKGTGEAQVELTGQYIASKNIHPDFSFSMKARNGYISNNHTPSPVQDLYLDMVMKVPHLNPDSLSLSIDSLHFRIDKDYFNSKFSVNGLKSPEIFARINTEVDLEKWNRAFGVKSVDLKGRYALHLLAEGKYATGLQKRGIRHVDTVITSVPKFSLRSSFRDGYVKYPSVPEAIKNISFDLNASCPDNDVKHFTMQFANLNVNALNNYLKGYFKLSNASGLAMDGALQSKFSLDDLKKIYPVEGSDLRGDLSFDVEAKGRYIPKQKIFPVIKADINLANGYIKTKYYPDPIKDVQVSASITDNTGSLSGLKVNIKPVSLTFEGQPFLLKADLRNFADLQYNIHSKGTLDIGKIYKVFAIKGYGVNGLITTNFTLKGKQSDATAGRYDQLFNKGTMKVKDLALTSDLFPKPFIIKTGVFSFVQDKMKFDAFTANYGNSVIVLDGALSNVIDYAMKPNAPLTGTFNLKSGLILADDFMAFADGPPPAANTNQPAKTAAAPTGVVLVPSNLNLTFTADVKKVKYQGLDINDVKGEMDISNGQIVLKQAGFTMIDAPVVMDATYGSINPQRAYFDYHINAKEFDIKKAYNQVKLFHDMATSASSAEGIVSLDYKLSGKLNKDMKPIYPSLKGGGVLSIKKVKIKGFRLFGSVAKETGKDSLGKPGDVSKVDIKTTIANNIITIERTKMRIAGFRPRFEGQVSFNGELNLKFRLGLPPLGIFGIPMTITGTQANPKVHLGRGKKEDELKEEADTTE
ncbi:AsmA family protein [Mucilaginibacter sp.]|jgi:AsmA protein|uniref:AsmA family protein n=1 Tax=Mucilaginibacter sp. TaxID=1882438 RepID=UPI002BBB65CE|nr:AsmA-like C-terminal region-containing protein [Mucilaginibacter sp.]HTI60441.1 AsmA-like C-terminal region-containing protein [Mucilaginibacter sp.]